MKVKPAVFLLSAITFLISIVFMPLKIDQMANPAFGEKINISNQPTAMFGFEEDMECEYIPEYPSMCIMIC